MNTHTRASAYSLDHVSDSELHLSTRRRRARAARLCREFPVILEHIAAGEIHLTALLLLGPHLTEENHRELLARAKHRTKREVLRLVRRLAPEPDVPASVEPLGPPPVGMPISRTPTWQQFIEAISGPVRELRPGDRPKEWITSDAPEDDSDLAVAKPPAALQEPPALPPAPERYKVQFTASQEYVDLLQQAKDLSSHALPYRLDRTAAPPGHEAFGRGAEKAPLCRGEAAASPGVGPAPAPVAARQWARG